jgi:cytochrome c-type biogenesis protein CcmE
MTRKQRRGVLIIVGLALVSVAVGLSLWAMQGSVTYFRSPSDVAKQRPVPGQRFRLGGLVEDSHKGPGATLTFRITDGANSLPVTYSKEVPDLFRDGQGAIAEGSLGADGVFVADTVLAKHDEKYMPPEVAAALKKNGRWQEQGGQQKAPGT